MKKIFYLGLVLASVTALSSCAGKQTSTGATNDSSTKQTTSKKEASSSSSAKKQESTQTTQSSIATTTAKDESQYPKITKALLNGKSWYEGSSTGVENQPRQGFSDDQFHDLFGNELAYEIIVDDNEQTDKVLDFRKNESVDINLKTKIKVNQPTVDGTYRDVFYYLYYKYDGTLMIAREGSSSAENQLTSYPLEEINIWDN